MSNLLVVSIFAVITLALVLWFFLRLDKEKQVSERYYDALQSVQVELRNVKFEKDRLANEKLALEKEMDFQAKKFDLTVNYRFTIILLSQFIFFFFLLIYICSV